MILITLKDFNFLGYMKEVIKEPHAYNLIKYGEDSDYGYIPICIASLRYLSKFYGRVITEGDEIKAIKVAKELKIK